MGRPLRRLAAVLLPLLVLAAGAGGLVLLARSRPQPAAAPAEARAWRVAVRTVHPGPKAPVLTLYGRVEAPRLARLRAAVGAEVVEVAVREGEAVAAGALLVRLDGAEITAELAQRRGEVAEIEAALASEALRDEADRTALARERELLRLAEAEVERVRGMMARGLASDAELDRARRELLRQRLAVDQREAALRDHGNRLAQLRARLAQARARLRRAELDRARTRITAPFAGRIAAVAVAPGDRVRAGDALAEIYDLAALEVRAQIPGPRLALVRAALAQGPLEADGRVDGAPLRLRLERLAGRAEATAGGLDGLFRILDAQEPPALGRFVAVRLALPPQPAAVALPAEALYGDDRVYEVVDGRLRAVRVERLGTDAEGRVLVRSPELADGDRVLVTQLPEAVTGLAVEAVEG
ncbi:efflux RND transporter periplasmic adaptor subunit [Inmirania thermothiophila]|uniref:Multidrug resistance efflux pump n=1 Tax=Inmirania thermothiophila TaxID=1750597 RepID=A0A3N1Y2I4_9GAMM|nr:HlyD family efflux transporter periplasmic adaptor subunit [Inmirania thermothiophila]ROR32728.1 multidrug resistance efflux pump [Inmirania thermothiophila]